MNELFTDNKFDWISDTVFEFLYNAEQYANASRDSNGREMINEWLDNVYSLVYFKPFFRTIMGKDHTMFVIDVDTEVEKEYTIYYSFEELRENRIKAALDYFDKNFEYKNDFLTYVSGKGMYLVQKVNEIISPHLLKSVVFNIFDVCKKNRCKCGKWHQVGQELVKIHEYNELPVKLKIDLRMYSKGKRLFRSIYSPYFKFKGRVYYCAPVVKNEKNFDIEETIKRTRFDNLIVDDIIIPSFSFNEMVEVKKDEEPIVMEKGNRNIKHYGIGTFHIHVPEPEDELTKEQRSLLKEIIEKVSSKNPEITPPCIRNCYEQKYNRFWSRVHLGRYLAALGYSPDEVALFFRFVINDEEDNSPQNRGYLKKGIQIVFGNDPSNPIPPTSCSKLQDQNHPHFSCSREDAFVCGRSYVLEKYKSLSSDAIKLNVIENKTKNSFDDIIDKVDTILRSNDNFEVIKTTRAGFTTTLVSRSIMYNKRLLVVVPTNKIGMKTFPEAVKMCHEMYDVDIHGAMITTNKYSCIKVMEKIRNLNAKMRKKINNFDFNGIFIKPECVPSKNKKCEFYDRNFNYPLYEKGIPLPVIKSDWDNGICAYSTIIKNFNLYDVIFITYDKLKAVIMGNEELYKNIIDNIDLIFLDEVSYLSKKSPIKIDIYSENRDTGEIIFEFFDNLEYEIEIFNEFVGNNNTSQFLSLITRKFIDEMEPIIFDIVMNENFDFDTFEFNSMLDEDEQDYLERNFLTMYNYFNKILEIKNEYLTNLDKMITLLRSRYWYIQNIPNYSKSIDISFVSSPDIQYVRDFIIEMNRKGKQIVVTDATMPLISMEELLQIKTNEFILGDPKNTQKSQLIVTDSRKIPAMYLNSNENVYRILDFIHKVCNVYGESNVMIVTSSSKGIYKRLKKELYMYNDLLVTYFRSDVTVGISTKRRVMITIGSPIPPRNSYMWLAKYYHKWGIFDELSIKELSYKLEVIDAYQTFYQTIGRVKSPTSNERSIVYCIGMKIDDLMKMLKNEKRIQYPNIVSSIKPSNMVDIGKKWIDNGIILDQNAIHVIEAVSKKGMKISVLSAINNYLGNRKINKKKIIDEIKKLDESGLLREYGLKLEKKRTYKFIPLNNVLS